MSLTLYYHPLSSYCHKVLVALYEIEAAFEKRTVNLGDLDERAELRARWPIGKFPVIHDHVRKRDLPETTVIIEYLDHFYAGKRPLIPSDFDEALEVRLWDRIFDNYLQGPMQEIVGDRLRNANGDLSKARSTLDTAYRMVDRQLSSGRTWVASQEFSMADCAAAPGLFYASTLVPFPDECGHLKAYFERLVDRPSVRRVLAEAKPYLSFFPFHEAIPARFR